MREVLRGNLRFRARVEREDELGFLSRSFNAMVLGLEERERIKDTFGRFVSHDVAEAVLNDRIPLAGERLRASILFQDIRGFSVLGQTLDPAALLRLLNEFFSEVVASVENEGGTVKQFTGDGIMVHRGRSPPRRTIVSGGLAVPPYDEENDQGVEQNGYEKGAHQRKGDLVPAEVIWPRRVLRRQPSQCPYQQGPDSSCRFPRNRLPLSGPLRRVCAVCSVPSRAEPGWS